MPPSSEPTGADITAVANGLGIPETVQQNPQQPAEQPQAQPQQPLQQPPAPTPQPSPTQQQAQPQAQADPFENLFQTPAEPGQPQAQPQAPAPVEPAQPQPQPAPAAAPATPAAPVEQPQAPAPMTSDQYIESLTNGLPAAPGMPDMSKVNPEDEASIGQFFTDLMETAEKRFEAKFARDQAIQNAERRAWEDSFEKYPSLRTNKGLRDTVHAIRRAKFDAGEAITPTQAAEQLLTSMGQQYRQGVTDNQVQTTIEQVQPINGNGQALPTTLTEQSVLESLQTGGETALETFLDNEVKAGRL